MANRQTVLNNTKLEIFNRLSSKAKTQSMSVVKAHFDQEFASSTYYSSGHPLNLVGDGLATLSLGMTKQGRIANYRMISNYNEVGEAVDEIADAHITSHPDDKFVKLKLNRSFKDSDLIEIQTEADAYFGLFNFKDNIYEYARKLTIEGELTFENIVDSDDTEKGFIDIRFLPVDTYEFAYDLRERRKTGIVILGESPASDPATMDTKRDAGYGYSGAAPATTMNCYNSVQAGKAIYMPFEQVTYINSGIYDRTGLIVYPALERARRAYNQLQMVEDAVLIYRWVRAPVRNVFSVNCGKMSQAKAERFVRTLADSFTSRRTYDPASGSIVGTYEPFNILENLWIPRSAESDGVQVSDVGGTASWGELDDLNYFLRKLYRALKVPSTRLITGSSSEAGDKTVQLSDEITYEEYRFAKYIVRSLACFSRGLKDGLINHLKLTGAWKRHDLSVQDIDVSIASPIELEIYRKQRMLEQQLDLLVKWSGIDGLSLEVGMERILGMSALEIKANRDDWKKEQLDAAQLRATIKAIVGNDGKIKIPVEDESNRPKLNSEMPGDEFDAFDEDDLA